MTDREQKNFEAELQRFRPARPPIELTDRLREANPRSARPQVPSRRSFQFSREFSFILRWLVPPAFAAASVVAITQFREDNPGVLAAAPSAAVSRSNLKAGPPSNSLKADDVRIDTALVSSFDAVGRLPGGEPVRFRCEQWMDQIVVSDKERGLVIENRKPRIEVAAVRYETY